LILDCNTNKMHREFDAIQCGSPRWRWFWHSVRWLAEHPRFSMWLSVGLAIAFMAAIGVPAVWDGVSKLREVR
jgi:hypothetical protein